LMPDHKADEFARTHEADFAFSLEDVGRFRVNVLRQQGDTGLAIRWVSAVPPTFLDLNLPEVIPTLVEVKHGLVLVTGPTGSGKTTTIASLLGFINRTRRAHIVTIEDPIEVIHVDDMGIVRQREVGLDTESYETGLRQVLRQDPDVVFVGEIRESSSAMAAIQAAQTGHLVMSTMHTIDAEETINRMIDLFPSGQQQQARLSLGGALRGIISQRLLERLDRVGRIPATEVMINTGRVRSALTSPEGMGDITRLLEESAFDGMHSFDQDLLRLTKEGFVSEADAMMVATNPHDFGIALQSVSVAAPGV
jgi:twitching motility protein PilT